jgi:hypothetical protein
MLDPSSKFTKSLVTLWVSKFRLRSSYKPSTLKVGSVMVSIFFKLVLDNAFDDKQLDYRKSKY